MLFRRPAAPRPAEYRDRAILLLLARLGLRAGEIAALELDDLDWRAGQLRLQAGKCRRERVLPLPEEAGAALVEYLRHGRPRPPAIAPTTSSWPFSLRSDYAGTAMTTGAPSHSKTPPLGIIREAA
jgi:integrase